MRPVLDFIKAAGGQGWFPYLTDATAESVREARERGLQVAAWTVNDPGDMARLIALRLRGSGRQPSRSMEHSTAPSASRKYR